jgi:hypothetical protein
VNIKLKVFWYCLIIQARDDIGLGSGTGDGENGTNLFEVKLTGLGSRLGLEDEGELSNDQQGSHRCHLLRREEGLVRWLTPVIPTPWEVETGGVRLIQGWPCRKWVKEA